jgi:integrase/recombinase XerD
LLDKVDYALVTFCWASGCRTAETASMSIACDQGNWVDLGKGLVVIHNGKWDSTGSVPLDTASLKTIRWYVHQVRPQIKNAAVIDRLFLTKTGSPYTPNKLSKKISMLLSRYGFPDKSAHSFRHFYCTDLFKRGARLHEAQSLMRHRDVRSTMVYTHPTSEDLRIVVNRRIA